MRNGNLIPLDSPANRRNQSMIDIQTSIVQTGTRFRPAASAEGYFLIERAYADILAADSVLPILAHNFQLYIQLSLMEREMSTIH
jgi:hypothetical protein